MQVSGKLQEERDRPRDDNSSRSTARRGGFLDSSAPATRGSLGVDLATAVSITLSDKSVAAIPTGIQGPLSNTPLGGLLLGRSSVGLKGLMVIPGVIDADHVGEIKVMAYTLNPPLFIPKGTKIAQLVALQNHQPCAGAQVDRAGGFGSTDHVICFTRSLASRPMMNVTLSIGSHQITVTGMIDSGADVTICSTMIWPKHWPLTSPATGITGVGGSSATYLSAQVVTLKFEEKTISARLYVMALPANLQMLIGRDILSQLGAVITTDSKDFP